MEADMIWESDDGKFGSTYPVVVRVWGPKKTIFVDVCSEKTEAVVHMGPTPSGKLHSHRNSITPVDWTCYVGTYSPKAIEGIWRREDGAYGGTGKFRLVLKD